jgi:hypothetical protein
MKNNCLQKIWLVASFLAAAGNTGAALAHSAEALIDGAGNNASATDLAQVICYDDGNGAPHHLYTQIQDLSGPVPGLLVSTQIFTDKQMTSTTDPVSGDAYASNPAILVGSDSGGGVQVYYISVSKTAAGPRTFSITYHCQTANDTHTGTDISVLQVQ